MRKSAGIFLYRFQSGLLEVFLVHPGGPFWLNKDAGAWSIPKGEFTDEEAPLAAAKREFAEETGTQLSGNFLQLSPIKQKGGKIVYAWALEGNIDAANIQCNMFQIQWPPNSGQWKTYPEVDKAEWFSIAAAKEKINTAQIELLDELVVKVGR